MGAPGTQLGTQSHTAAYPGLSGPFVTAAVPWIDRVDFLLLTLPQLCQLAFVSEGNLVENVTLQMGKLQAFFFFFFAIVTVKCLEILSTLSDRFVLDSWSQWLVQHPDVAIDVSTLRTGVTGIVAVLIIGF